MDYGIVAKMVQADLCSQGLVAASVESAPLLIESYLKRIGMCYTSDDLNVISKIMTLGVSQVTPCTPNSAVYEESQDQYDDYSYNNDEYDEAVELLDNLDFMFDELSNINDYKESIISQITEFEDLIGKINSIIPDTMGELNLTIENFSKLRNSVEVISDFYSNYYMVIHNAIEDKAS